MADYDSDSSNDVEDIHTNILLGYASKEPTGDDFSQLGGLPTWLDDKTAPSGGLGKCKVCNGVLSLLLQLNGDLPERFPGHERRLYVFGCRRKACRRKSGSVRALRAVRSNKTEKEALQDQPKANGGSATQAAPDLGNALFGVQSPTSTQGNPFSSLTAGASGGNPFSPTRPSLEQPSPSASREVNTSLSETFAQKARISADSDTPKEEAIPSTSEPWQKDPSPYPSYYLDADKEYLDPSSLSDDIPSTARIDTDGESNTAAEEKALFESSMDRTFQRFADRLAQNPEQILRYEFGGQPLLYSKTDAVGKLLSPPPDTKVQTSSSRNGTTARIPRCTNCGSARGFELQLTPHAITELEAEEMSLEGMDWGTVIVGVCGEDCQEKGKGSSEVGYVEEWAGVQWEEIADHKKA